MEPRPIHEHRFARAIEELEQAGVRRAYSMPPEYWLLRWCGVRVRPPYYCSFGVNALAAGTYMAVVFGVGMSVFVWAPQGWNLVAAAVAVLFTSTFFGLMTALPYIRKARQYKLSRWQDLGPLPTAEEIRNRVASSPP